MKIIKKTDDYIPELTKDYIPFTFGINCNLNKMHLNKILPHYCKNIHNHLKWGDKRFMKSASLIGIAW
jgi:hypothetical protein